MRALGLFIAVSALTVFAQEADAGFGLSSPDAPVETPVVEPPTDAGIPNPDPAPEPLPSFAHTVEMNGYAALRGTFTKARVGGLLPSNDVPQLSALLELNGQLKVKYLPTGFVYGDLSVIGQAAGNYKTANAAGEEMPVPEHDVASFRPLISLNELYLLHEFIPELNVMVGKRRIVWGPGQAINPTDLLNIRRDPTDPTFQRAGAWLARVEVPLERVTFTALFSPAVLKQANGVPQQFLVYPEWDKQDDQAHYLAALRAYALVADSDVNVFLYYSNLYNDAFEKKVRGGGSFSRVFFDSLEVHTEFLLQTGSSRDFIDPECVESQAKVIDCAVQRRAFISKSRLNEATLNPRLLAGARQQFSDDSFLSVEYLYQADGYDRRQYQDLVNAFDRLGEARAQGISLNAIPGAAAFAGGSGLDNSQGGIPQRFSFEPTVQHYLFVTAQKPRVFDDFTLQLVMLANLQDLSTLWTPSVSWSATEWMTVTALGFVPVPGPNALAAKRANGAFVTEYGSLPMQYRFLLEARVFY